MTNPSGQPRRAAVAARSSRNLAAVCCLAAAGYAAVSTNSWADDAVTLPAPPAVSGQTAPGAQPTNPEFAGMSLLILSFDSKALNNKIPGADNPSPPLDAPKPIVPGMVGAVTPASGTALRTGWVVLADKKDKNKDKDDAKFRLEPDLGTRGPTAAAPAAAPQPAQPAPLPLGPTTARSMDPAGDAQLAALPLRRALMGLGVGDVMPASPDSTFLARSIDSGRLTPRVLESLRLAMVDLVAAPGKPADDDVAQGIKAAVRVGQSVGYRAVLVLAVKPGTEGGRYTMLLADSMKETGEPLIFDEKGPDELTWRETGGSTAAALVQRSLRRWPDVTTTDRAALATTHLEAARAALLRGDTATGQDELNQTIALDPQRGESYVLLGDLLKNSDPAGAASAYRRAVELNARDGDTWVKIAQSFVTSKPPDWARAIDAGNKAIGLGVDTAALRIALATAQYGRAELFRKAERLDRAEDAEFNARQHLDRALQLAPDDPTAVRLLTKQLITQQRYEEAVQMLDRVAPMYPKDLDIQTQYATVLSRLDGREEDAFVASSRVWKISGVKTVDLDAPTYRHLAEGFDARVYSIGRSCNQLTTAVANAALPRESALLQIVKLKEDMAAADEAINKMRPPFVVGTDVRDARIFAADLMTQALENHQMYLETTQDINRVRGLELIRQAIAQLNTARSK